MCSLIHLEVLCRLVPYNIVIHDAASLLEPHSNTGKITETANLGQSRCMTATIGYRGKQVNTRQQFVKRTGLTLVARKKCFELSEKRDLVLFEDLVQLRNVSAHVSLRCPRKLTRAETHSLSFKFSACKKDNSRLRSCRSFEKIN